MVQFQKYMHTDGTEHLKSCTPLRVFTRINEIILDFSEIIYQISGNRYYSDIFLIATILEFYFVAVPKCYDNGNVW